jgi:diaminohydroxyphosphoribosylaminopyrimidine deaminase / 5-amino-6-(5-phosphoribosylamino)uracil reductase
MTEDDDIKFMRRCIELAQKAEGLTYPNPMVGAVVVHNGKIIGEGYHLKTGDHHAEVNAINSVTDKSKLSNSTLYVNLEPCSHFGKTPPCADFIISHSIPRVVVGTIDSSSKVSGKGIEKLMAAGCEVITDVLKDECRKLNKRFFTFHEKKRPYITLKWAQSADGYIDVLRTVNKVREPNWISGKPERVLVHKWRASEQAILVGARTVREDNPRLDVREWKGNNPLRLVLSGTGSLPEDSAIFDKNGETVVFTYNADVVIHNAVKVKLEQDRSSPEQISDYLYQRGIQSLLIEGGADLINHFISDGLWDEAKIFCGKSYFGKGVKAPVVDGQLLSTAQFEGSLLSFYKNIDH